MCVWHADNSKPTESVNQAEQLRALQQENHQLTKLIIKLKAMHTWRSNHLTNNYLKTVSILKHLNALNNHLKTEYFNM